MLTLLLINANCAVQPLGDGTDFSKKINSLLPKTETTYNVAYDETKKYSIQDQKAVFIVGQDAHATIYSDDLSMTNIKVETDGDAEVYGSQIVTFTGAKGAKLFVHIKNNTLPIVLCKEGNLGKVFIQNDGNNEEIVAAGIYSSKQTLMTNVKLFGVTIEENKGEGEIWFSGYKTDSIDSVIKVIPGLNNISSFYYLTFSKFPIWVFIAIGVSAAAILICISIVIVCCCCRKK